MKLKRKYEITTITPEHPLYLDSINQLEIHISDDNDNHWLFYIAPKPYQDIHELLYMIDDFDEEVLDMLTKVWDVTTNDNKGRSKIS